MLEKLGQHPLRSLEISGTLSGFALNGAFHSWHDGESDRTDETLGIREESTYRVGGREFAVNSSGDVRELHGLLAARQKTEDLIGSDAFLDQPQYATLLGRTKLDDGREVFQIVFAPPEGQKETVSLDAATSMIDRISYAEVDGTSTVDYYDYRPVEGALVPFKEVESNGDHAYDVTQLTTGVRVNRPIPAATFAVPANAQIQTDKPVTVPLVERQGHYYTTVSIRGRDFTFLVDTGAQGVVIDSRAASQLVLMPNGRLEVSGATRTGGLGIAQLQNISIGGAALPIRVVSILDLSRATGGRFPIDGILGYPLFAEAEVRIDPDKMTMTIGKPGSLQPVGTRFPLDVDRELPEINASIAGVHARFLLDTGNGSELLVFNPFMQAHPGLIRYVGNHAASNYGVGGSMPAVATIVDELDIGKIRLFNRYADVIFSDSGAFADKFDAGNIGMATLKNFVTTFDLANSQMYLAPGAHFDDGRDRPVVE